MKATDLRRVSAYGADSRYWNHAAPIDGVDNLIPALLTMDKIKLEKKIVATSSVDAYVHFTERGANVQDLPFAHYNPSTYVGKNRLLDNSDILKGKEPVYGDLSTAFIIVKELRQVIQRMIEYYESNPTLVAQAELEDLIKITIQAWKPTGWINQKAIATQPIPQVTNEMRQFIRKVTNHYAMSLKRKFPDVWKANPIQLRMMDDDPADTLTGMPLCEAGERTIPARIQVLKAIPDPVFTSVAWTDLLDNVGSQMLLPAGYMYSPILSTRYGPLRKPTLLYTLTPGGLLAQYEAVGAYNRVRFVYPAPFHVNYVWSPLYVQMSHARKSILGLWHDPQSQIEYIKYLKKYRFSYAVDFSGMDTSIYPHMVQELFAALQHSGFDPISLRVIMQMYPKMGVIYPSMLADRHSASFVTGPARPWASGFKLTSEIDTLYGLCVILWSLSKIFPNILELWIRGDFTIAELGDDILFTCSSEIDVDALKQVAMSDWGADLEVKRDTMFLKWLMPVDPSVPLPTRSFARFIQQTFFNEDRYTGTEGGDKPSAIMRIGLSSRLVALKDHPHFSMWWPIILPVVRRLVYYTDASADWKSSVDACRVPTVSSSDAAAIQEYAQKVPSYFQKLVDRAKFEPSAAITVRMLQENNDLAYLANPASKEVRKAYAAAIAHTPTRDDVKEIAARARDVVYGSKVWDA